MELEDLKRSWGEYDQKLTKNLEINGELLRRSYLDRSRRSMNTPLVFEIISATISVLFTLFILRATIRYGGDPRYLVSGILTILCFLLSLAASFRKIRTLRRIDYANGNVLELQKGILSFQTFYTKVRKWELYTLPVVFLVIFPIYTRAAQGVDILSSPLKIVGYMAVMLAFSYPVGFWIYRNLYDEKVKAANRFLLELEEFEKEE